MNMRDMHIGLQVPDLDEALARLNALFGLGFADVIEMPVAVRIDDEIEHATGRFTVSRSGPPYLEVTENVPGSKIWRTREGSVGVHHIGFWIDDVAASADRLSSTGYPIEAAGLTEDGRYRYTYHLVDGLRIELCPSATREAFERWAQTGKANGVAEQFLGSGDPVGEN